MNTDAQTIPDPFWNRIISDWALVGPPLRPTPEETAVMEAMVRDWHREAACRSPRAGILGVTSEIVAMRWPEQTHISAFDKEPSIIAALWPKGGVPHAEAVCCNWLSLPIPDSSLDVVTGDGPLTQLSSLDEYRELARELARVVAPGGLLVLRLFVPPSERETVDSVFEELWCGRIENASAFRWRLLMSLQESPETGICLGDAWEEWHTRVSSPERLAETLGWPVEAVRVIDRYRSVATVYTFTPLDSVCALLEPDFSLTGQFVPSYRDGVRYPTVCFRRS